LRESVKEGAKVRINEKAKITGQGMNSRRCGRPGRDEKRGRWERDHK